MGGLAGPQAQLTHLSFAWHNLCAGQMVFRWSGSEGTKGGVFVLTEIQKDATGDRYGDRRQVWR